MKLTEFMIVIVAALMFLIPTMKQETTAFEREAQEEAPEEIKEEKHQDVRKPESSPDFELIDDELNEGEEASQ